MGEEHYKTLSAVFPMIMRMTGGNREVLLHKRANTGYMDGMWDFAGSGHVDANETAKQAVLRECKEEIGITVKMDDVSFAHLSHALSKNSDRTYYDIYFVVYEFSGIPFIAEPDKSSDLKWFCVINLPTDMIDIRKTALENYFNSIYYSEIIY
jgi:8-oxo-dGTP diphosphatase